MAGVVDEIRAILGEQLNLGALLATQDQNAEEEKADKQIGDLFVKNLRMYLAELKRITGDTWKGRVGDGIVEFDRAGKKGKVDIYWDFNVMTKKVDFIVEGPRGMQKFASQPIRRVSHSLAPQLFFGMLNKLLGEALEGGSRLYIEEGAPLEEALQAKVLGSETDSNSIRYFVGVKDPREGWLSTTVVWSGARYGEAWPKPSNLNWRDGDDLETINPRSRAMGNAAIAAAQAHHMKRHPRHQAVEATAAHQLGHTRQIKVIGRLEHEFPLTGLGKISDIVRSKKPPKGAHEAKIWQRAQDLVSLVLREEDPDPYDELALPPGDDMIAQGNDGTEAMDGSGGGKGRAGGRRRGKNTGDCKRGGPGRGQGGGRGGGRGRGSMKENTMDALVEQNDKAGILKWTAGELYKALKRKAKNVKAAPYKVKGRDAVLILFDAGDNKSVRLSIIDAPNAYPTTPQEALAYVKAMQIRLGLGKLNDKQGIGMWYDAGRVRKDLNGLVREIVRDAETLAGDEGMDVKAAFARAGGRFGEAVTEVRAIIDSRTEAKDNGEGKYKAKTPLEKAIGEMVRGQSGLWITEPQMKAMVAELKKKGITKPGKEAYDDIARVAGKFISKHKKSESGGAPTPPARLNRRAPAGHYQVWFARDNDPNPYIDDWPSIQVAMRRAKERAKLAGAAHVVIYDELGNHLKVMLGESYYYGRDFGYKPGRYTVRKLKSTVKIDGKVVPVEITGSVIIDNEGDIEETEYKVLVRLDTKQRLDWRKLKNTALHDIDYAMRDSALRRAEVREHVDRPDDADELEAEIAETMMLDKTGKVYDVKPPTKKGMVSKRPSKGTPTDTNLFALNDVFGDRDEVPNQLNAPDVPHIRRMLKAKCVEVRGKNLKLTALGKALLKQWQAKFPRQAKKAAERINKKLSVGNRYPTLATHVVVHAGPLQFQQKVKDIAQASKVVRDAIEDGNYGFSEVGGENLATIYAGTKKIGTVSYNGRVWTMKKKPLWNPWEGMVGEGLEEATSPAYATFFRTFYREVERLLKQQRGEVTISLSPATSPGTQYLTVGSKGRGGVDGARTSYFIDGTWLQGDDAGSGPDGFYVQASVKGRRPKTWNLKADDPGVLGKQLATAIAKHRKAGGAIGESGGEEFESDFEHVEWPLEHKQALAEAMIQGYTIPSPSQLGARSSIGKQWKADDLIKMMDDLDGIVYTATMKMADRKMVRRMTLIDPTGPKFDASMLNELVRLHKRYFPREHAKLEGVEFSVADEVRSILDEAKRKGRKKRAATFGQY